jgi:hypothetical protein
MDQVVTLAAEEVVLAQADEDIEVTGRAAAETSFAFARDAQLLSIVDPRGDVEWELVVATHAALAPALRAERVDGLARSAAAWAGRDVLRQRVPPARPPSSQPSS